LSSSFCLLDWEDIALAGALAEEISESLKECERIRKEMEEEQEKVDADKCPDRP